jgi:hypothetical protein
MGDDRQSKNAAKARYNKLKRLSTEMQIRLSGTMFDEVTPRDIADLRDWITDSVEAFYEFNAYHNAWQWKDNSDA